MTTDGIETLPVGGPVTLGASTHSYQPATVVADSPDGYPIADAEKSGAEKFAGLYASVRYSDIYRGETYPYGTKSGELRYSWPDPEQTHLANDIYPRFNPAAWYYDFRTRIHDREGEPRALVRLVSQSGSVTEAKVHGLVFTVGKPYSENKITATTLVDAGHYGASPGGGDSSTDNAVYVNYVRDDENGGGEDGDVKPVPLEFHTEDNCGIVMRDGADVIINSSKDHPVIKLETVYIDGDDCNDDVINSPGPRSGLYPSRDILGGANTRFRRTIVRDDMVVLKNAYYERLCAVGVPSGELTTVKTGSVVSPGLWNAGCQDIHNGLDNRIGAGPNATWHAAGDMRACACASAALFGDKYIPNPYMALAKRGTNYSFPNGPIIVDAGTSSTGNYTQFRDVAYAVSGRPCIPLDIMRKLGLPTTAFNVTELGVSAACIGRGERGGKNPAEPGRRIRENHIRGLYRDLTLFGKYAVVSLQTIQSTGSDFDHPNYCPIQISNADFSCTTTYDYSGTGSGTPPNPGTAFSLIQVPASERLSSLFNMNMTYNYNTNNGKVENDYVRITKDLPGPGDLKFKSWWGTGSGSITGGHAASLRVLFILTVTKYTSYKSTGTYHTKIVGVTKDIPAGAGFGDPVGFDANVVKNAISSAFGVNIDSANSFRGAFPVESMTVMDDLYKSSFGRFTVQLQAVLLFIEFGKFSFELDDIKNATGKEWTGNPFPV